ncbi:MAG: hypothetical protein HKM04_06185 [Legionellales bacterium]|nr:hypothetical protein [Legionellales bacterium]
MKSSCISHPAKEPLVMARQWQVAFCDGDFCAALLLSYFEYWHNIKLEHADKNKKTNEIAESYGDLRTQDESLLQYHTFEEFGEGILGAFGQSKIRDAINRLLEKGAISQYTNPNPKYKFDKTKFYQFHPEVCIDYLTHSYKKNDLINAQNTDNTKSNLRTLNSTARSLRNKVSTIENNESTVEFNVPITETTSEIPNREEAEEEGVTFTRKQNSASAAPFLAQSDRLIGDSLTPTQNKQVMQAVNQLFFSGYFPCSLEEAISSITETLLSESAYTKAGVDFWKKLNVIKKSIQNGTWTPPIDALLKKQENLISELENWQQQRKKIVEKIRDEDRKIEQFTEFKAIAQQRNQSFTAHETVIVNAVEKRSTLLAELTEFDKTKSVFLTFADSQSVNGIANGVKPYSARQGEKR